jgi:sugar lactone lactonase YvrE
MLETVTSVTEIELVLDAKATLAEGPAWDARTQTLYWVDILERRLHILDETAHFVQLEDVVSCVAPCADGGPILALHNRLAKINLHSGALTVLAVLGEEPSTNRFNDGKCGPDGRFLAGTMDVGEREASGSLYSLAPDGQVSRLLAGVTISNGMAWSPDHKTLFHIDTPTREVRAYAYNVDTGQVAFERVAVRVPAEHGWPDGMTSDMDGNLWIAMWGGSQVTRWDPEAGRLLDQFRVPAPHVTSCVFGGKAMNDLYVTSARQGLGERELADFPQSGGVFRLRTSVTGMPTFEFGG